MVVEVVDVLVGNFHEGWERKGEVKVGEKSTTTRRPVEERIVGKTKGGKKREKERGK